MPFMVTAALTGFKGFELDEAEKKAVSPLTNAVLIQYAPNMGPHGALISLSIVLCALVGTKAMAYASWKEENRKLRERERSYPRSAAPAEANA